MLDADRVLDLIGMLLGGIDDAFSVVFLLIVIYTFIDGSIRKKNKTPSLPPSTDEFNVLPLDDQSPIEVRQEQIVPRGVTNNITEKYRQKHDRKRQIDEPARQTQESSPTREAQAALSADDAREAMILKEIFDRPKSMRRR